MDKQNSTEVIVLRAVELTVGKESGAWTRWWAYASRDVEGVGIALYAALLSLGAPPAPEHLTKDLTDIELGMLPPRVYNGPNADEWELHRARAEERLDRRWRQQIPYNDALNRFVAKHNMCYGHASHGPAQFRKLFAGFLHACKENDHV